MPWIDETNCTGCGICIEECPVDAIFMKNEEAEINMSECIRCGVCHDICPQEAVRHDSEQVPDIIKSNVEMTKKSIELCAKYLGDEEATNCLERSIKHFNREKLIAERTLVEIEKLRKE